MSENNIVIGFILVLLFVFYNLKMDNGLVENGALPEKVKNATNLGFVKPEHRLLKIFSSVSSGAKIKLEGICQKYIYNKNTIDKSVEDRLTAIMKELINTINKIAQNDYYIKQIENVYGLISCDGNQRYFIDFFVYDVKNYYTIRLISDIVIIDNEIYINYLNVQSGSNPTILNKYDIKFNDTGILFDGHMFKENIDALFDSFYRQSFRIIGVRKTDLDYTNLDFTEVVSMNSLRNMYFPSAISRDTVNELEKKDLSGYVEMYLPQNQLNIKSPMFCDKYKIEWDSYGVENSNNLTDKNCYVNQNSTQTVFNEPTNPPGLFNNERTDATHYDWVLKPSISNSL
mgnify:FL=1|tara:strand:+ start:3207 stop:4235 length:1029 start_codon:yes stop_codon:yes gene_type:complete